MKESNYPNKEIYAIAFIVAILLMLNFLGDGCIRAKSPKSKKSIEDPGPNLIFPWGKAEPRYLDGKSLIPLPKGAPSWAKEAEKLAARYYVKHGLDIVQSYAGEQELIFILTRPTGGNMVAKSLALWKRKNGDFIEVWRLDQDAQARKAIWRNHQKVKGIWGDSIIWTFGDETLFEAFTYHNYPYSMDDELGKSHSAIWADEVSVFERKGNGYIPIGSGVIYYKQGYYPAWWWQMGR